MSEPLKNKMKNEIELQALVASQILSGLLASGHYTSENSINVWHCADEEHIRDHGFHHVNFYALDDALLLTRLLFKTLQGESRSQAWPPSETNIEPVAA